MRPMILEVPTPFAMPANRSSTSRTTPEGEGKEDGERKGKGEGERKGET